MMKQNIDAIALLKEFIVQNKTIKCKDNHLYFDTIKLPLKKETAWLSKRSNKRYDLGSLWLFMDHQQKQTSSILYNQAIQEHKLEMVSIVDKNEILNYFQDKIDQTEDIDISILNSIKLQKRQRKSSQNGDELHKKVKTNNENDAESREKENIKQMELLNKIERPIDSKSKSLRKLNKSFKPILEYLNHLKEKSLVEQVNKNEKIEHSQLQQGSSLLSEILKLGGGFAGEVKPIILVPANIVQGNICMLNAFKFLNNGIYEAPNEADNVPNKIEIQKKIGNKRVVFEIKAVDPTMKQDVWKKVVAAFIKGSENEFNKWPDGNKPAILFNKIKGFVMKYHDVPLHDRVKKMNIKVVQIHRIKRYLDNNIKDEFWEELEKFLLAPRKQQNS